MTTGFYDLARPWLIAAGLAAAAAAAALIVHRIGYLVLLRLGRRPSAVVVRSLIAQGDGPARAVLVIYALDLVVPRSGLPLAVEAPLRQAFSLLLTLAIGWLAYKLTRTINDVAAVRYNVAVADNLLAREAQTRLRILQRLLAVVVVLLTAGLLLTAVPDVRQIGVTLFASAGIAGIVAGLAARPVLTNLLAGIQLALTQPIRIDDVVIIEGEWGWIEEIRMTFVVVRIWDLRRLIVPLSYFSEKPFQNWTRQTADLLGTVFLYMDYTVPVDRIRRELHQILQDSPLWDGKVWNLQVTDARDTTVELRALMGARNSGEAWDLRCHVREELIKFLQREYPDALPRIRAEALPRTPDQKPAEARPSPRQDR